VARVNDAPLRLMPLWRTVGALLIGFVIYDSLTPYPVELPFELPFVPVEHGDKLGHGLAYATLMLWFALIDSERLVRVRWAVTFIAMGILLEFVQRFIGYRMFEVNDMVSDVFGVGIGWLAAPPRLPNPLRYLEARLDRPAMTRPASDDDRPVP
jgi:VanZ family protein